MGTLDTTTTRRGGVPIHCTGCGAFVGHVNPPAPPVPVRCSACRTAGMAPAAVTR